MKCRSDDNPPHRAERKRKKRTETASEMDDAGFSSLQSAMRHQQMAAK
jgi:hypothetical protein